MRSSEARSLRRWGLHLTDDGRRTHRRRKKKNSSPFNMIIVFLVVVAFINLHVVNALPFPPPDLGMCGMAYNTTEYCCTLPISRSGNPIKKFDLTHAKLPLRFRRAAHLLDDAYIEKYQRAMELMRALPETDGRSFTAQTRLHCAYCDNHLYYPGNAFPLEIHQSWLFLPWHRLFLFFFERILASLLDDDTFALPFWNWDSQNSTEPFPNALPWMYYNNFSYSASARNQTSSLWDPDRNVCSKPPRLVEFQDFIRCDPRPFPDVTRVQNAHSLWTQMVSVAATPLVMAGGEYRYGDFGGRGMGAIEGRPHGPLHAWTNVRDMGTFRNAAGDPVFYGLHGNIDRMWEVWKTLPGKYRGEVTDPDYLNTELTFYDEEGEQVSATIKDFLNLANIGVKYEQVPVAWAEKGAPQMNGDPSWEFCSDDPSESATARLIANTTTFKAPLYVKQGPVAFKVRRRTDMNESHGEEMLELRVANFTWHMQHTLNLFAYLDVANATYTTASIGCAEYVGNLQSFPHPGMSPNMTSEMVFRMGIRRKLEIMGRSNLDHLVVTMLGQSYVSPTSPGESGMNITSAEIIYSTE